MTGQRLRVALIAFALAALVGGVYAPVVEHEFLAYDDVLYVTENSRVQAGLRAETIRWAFTSTEAGNWHPFVWLSHAADVELFGLDAGAHHATSVAVHAFGTALLFALLYSLTGSLLASALAAALFGLHPLRIESVAWIAERKDVLCGAFVVGALAAELRYARSPGLARGCVVAICVAGALLSKAMAVTLPAALLLFDVWPLGRLQSGPDGIVGSILKRSAARLAFEKLPLFAMAVAASAVAVRAQSAGGALAAVETWPLASRLANAATSYWVYLRKTLWPDDLAVFYPYPAGGIPAAQTFAAATLLAVVSAAAWVLWRARSGRRGLPGASFAWFWFVGTLLPVIGLVTVGEQALADRYTYVPHIGFAIAAAAGLAALERRGVAARGVAIAVATLAVAASAFATRALLPHWRSDRTLFARALAVTTDSRVAHLNYGNALEGVEPRDEQIRYFERAVELGPGDANAHYHLGRALALSGATTRGVEHYRISLGLDDRQPKAWNNLANALAQLGERGAAASAYRRALALDAQHTSANFNLALALAQEGKTDEARGFAERYVESDQSPASHAANLDVLARAFAAAGDLTFACDLLTAAELDTPALRALLAGLEWQRGNERAAIEAARTAFARAADDASIANDLAWMLATARDAELRDPARAIEVASRALALSGEADADGQRDPAVLDTLAAAYAASGDFEAAQRVASEAVEIAEARRGGGAGSALLEELRAHEAAYRVKRPLHEVPKPASERRNEPVQRLGGDTGG